MAPINITEEYTYDSTNQCAIHSKTICLFKIPLYVRLVFSDKTIDLEQYSDKTPITEDKQIGFKINKTKKTHKTKTK